MYKITPQLLAYMADNLQLGESRPNSKVSIYRKTGSGSYEIMPFVMKDIISIDVDNRWNMSADQADILIQNINGVYSPDYSNTKHYQGVSDLPISGYNGVMLPFNRIQIDFGYGDEMRRKFTGQLQAMEINEENPTLSATCLNEYRKLLKPIDPIEVRELSYTAQKASDIIADFCYRAGASSVIIDTDTVAGFDYSISSVKFELGITYTDAINTILSTMGHRIYADRDGAIRVKKLEAYSQTDANIWNFSDYINITSGSYKIDPGIIRNRIIVKSKSSWKAYEDPYLINYCNGERISMGVEVPWAETDQQKQMVANGLFLQMRRKLRRITIGIVGNPSMDIGDLAKLEMLTSTANAKYMITGIRSTFTESGYFDVVDLEFVTNDNNQFAVPASGSYTPSNTDQTPENRQKILDTAMQYLGTLYQYGGDKYHNSANYGFDNSHFVYAVMDIAGLYGTYKTIEELYAWTTPITKAELQIGDLVYYTNDQGQKAHVVIYIGNDKVIGAIGGTSSITTAGEAQKQQAMVKIQNIDYNGRPQLYGKVVGL